MILLYDCEKKIQLWQHEKNFFEKNNEILIEKKNEIEITFLNVIKLNIFIYEENDFWNVLNSI